MHIIEPKAYLVAETKFVDPESAEGNLGEYLENIHANQYDMLKGESELEDLIEVGGRLCYRSFQVGLNPNVTRIREDHQEYIGNILKSGHGSVLEHGVVSFIVVCSRVCTHELVRHRAGTAFSQESMRFVRLDDIPMWFPSCFTQDPNEERRRWVLHEMRKLVEHSESLIGEMAKRYDLDDPNSNFAFKKTVTSAMRRIAPSGHMTNILFTANIRALRHIIEMRTAPGAEEEIRIVFDQIAHICKERYPAVFQDFQRAESGAWVPTCRKV